MTELGIQGGCLCGAVRYRAASPPRISTICHCADCRKACGAPSVAWITFPAESFAFAQGEPSRYRSSPPVVRTFCGRCGTPLTYQSDERAHEIDVTTASLDDAEAFPPTKQVFPEQKLSWVEVASLRPGAPGSGLPAPGRKEFTAEAQRTQRKAEKGKYEQPPFLQPFSASSAPLAKRAVNTVPSEAPGAGSLELPPKAAPPVDLRPRLRQWGLGARRQGDRPTCSVFTVVAALEYAVASRQQHGTRLSVEFLNWAAHRAASRAADGGFFSELWEGYTAYGICPEEELPYQERYDAALQPAARARDAAQKLQALGLRLRWIKEWDPETGLTDGQLDTIKETLAQGWPVCGGFRWPRQARWEEADGPLPEVLQLCPPDEVYDGHSVLLVGYQEDERQSGGGVFFIRNSSGDGRDGALPYAYAQAYMNDAVWVELATSERTVASGGPARSSRAPARSTAP
jgi:hypothetical protein